MDSVRWDMLFLAGGITESLRFGLSEDIQSSGVQKPVDYLAPLDII